MNKPLKVSGDMLILAGDIVPLHDEQFNNSFFSFIATNYKQVFWIPGNHEFYHKDLSEFNTSFNIELRSNINIVNNVELLYENVRFVFSSLWTEIHAENEKTVEQGVSDFECITNNNRKLKAKDVNKLHYDCRQFIGQALEKNHPKTIVVTHHLPSAL